MNALRHPTTSIDRHVASGLLVQTCLDGGDDIRAMLDGLLNFLTTSRRRSGDLDTNLVLLAMTSQVVHADDFSRMQSVHELLRTDATSSLWMDERSIAASCGLTPAVVRRKLARLALEGLLIQRDSLYAIHPEAIADPLFGFDQIFRLARRR